MEQLEEGDVVWIKTSHEDKGKRGIIIAKSLQPDSYIVRSQGSNIRRNRKHLRKLNMDRPIAEAEEEEQEQEEETEAEQEEEEDEVFTEEESEEHEEQEEEEEKAVVENEERERAKKSHRQGDIG